MFGQRFFDLFNAPWPEPPDLESKVRSGPGDQLVDCGDSVSFEAVDASHG